MAQLDISNIINISVSQTPSGINAFNTSNLAHFTAEPYAVSFGTSGYKIYLSPADVATDFGTNSKTYQMALAVFSQKPNILAGNGSFIVIPYVVEVQTITPSAAPASGTYELNFGSDVTAAINWNDTAAQIQAKVRTLTGLEAATVTGTLATLVTVTFNGYYGNAALMTVTNNTLNGGITLAIAQATAGETFGPAITRTQGLVQYFGAMTDNILDQTDTLAAAAVIQAMNKIGFFIQSDPAEVDPGGILDLLRTGSFTQSRGLFYGDGTTQDALNMMAAYAGRGLSVNFDGSNTTITMHLKDLATIQPDTTMTQTLLDACGAAGADVYASFQGVAKVFTSGENSFFDQVYNLQAFVGALQVAGFNFLAQSSTKVPQTENGMQGLKAAYRQVCEQYVSNQWLAPGTWNSPTTFGNQQDLFDNIEQRGYYIYSAPVSQQSQAARAARQAPLVQIACKESGAIQSSDVIVYVNA